MPRLKAIEPIEECIAHASNGSEVKVVSHLLSSGACVTFLCEGPFMLTAARARALGKRLIELAIQARRSAMESDQEAGKPSDLIEAELVEEGGEEWRHVMKEVGCETEEHLTAALAYEELAREVALAKEYARQLKPGMKPAEREFRLLRDSLEKISHLAEGLKGYDVLTEMEEAFARLAEPYIPDPERRRAFAADVRRHVQEVVGEGKW